MPKTDFRGLLVPAITPLGADLAPDPVAFVDVCRHLLAQGAHGLAAFGTTSEANSFSVAERKTMLEALVAAGIPPAVLLPGTGMCSLADAVDLTKHAVSLGCGGVLMLPPFYYKPVKDDGLFAFYAEVIERVGSADLGLWLYHIPQNTGVGIPYALIERLIARYPDTVLGIKDSSGNWDNTAGMLKAFPGFRVFPSSEGVLAKAMALGAVGCITASGNVNPHGIRALYDGWNGPDAERLQAAAAAVRDVISGYPPLIPAVKAVLARRLGRPGLTRMRPPLVALSPAEENELMTKLVAAETRFVA
jgi:4-hydroxy-tetrahydrodipicolinate synthase